MSANNTAVRILVSVIAIPIILFICYTGRELFMIFILSIGLIAFYEYGQMIKKKGMKINFTIGFIAVSAVILNSYYNLVQNYPLFLIIAAVIMLSGLYWENGSPVNNLGAAFFGIFYTGYFTSAVIKIREFYADSGDFYVNGGYLIIALLASIWACDSAAFFLGTAFGKHKLYPKVSPNKSWEGAIAGLIFSVIAMIALKGIAFDFLSWETAAAIGLAAGIFGQLGDLVESLIKRDTGVKDSSALIPGHGGILDRFDSLLFTAPVVYLIMMLLSV